MVSNLDHDIIYWTQLALVIDMTETRTGHQPLFRRRGLVPHALHVVVIIFSRYQPCHGRAASASMKRLQVRVRVRDSATIPWSFRAPTLPSRRVSIICRQRAPPSAGPDPYVR